MKNLWLLYDDIDFTINQGFARMMKERGEPLGLNIEAVLLSEIALTMDENGLPGVLLPVLICGAGIRGLLLGLALLGRQYGSIYWMAFLSNPQSFLPSVSLSSVL